MLQDSILDFFFQIFLGLVIYIINHSYADASGGWFDKSWGGWVSNYIY